MVDRSGDTKIMSGNLQLGEHALLPGICEIVDVDPFSSFPFRLEPYMLDLLNICRHTYELAALFRDA